jgi:DNA (cytosine-5)-methyltransferase 1
MAAGDVSMIVDLFAGPGGWDVAARDLGLDPIGLELDAVACATRHAAGLKTAQTNVAVIDPQTLSSFWSVSGLLASPPCQAFSTAGSRKGRKDIPCLESCAHGLVRGYDWRAGYDWADPRSPLVLEPLRWALALKPEWMCWEQVPPVLPFWELCARILGECGYYVWTGLLHAEQFGVPQTRKRAFLIASRVGPVAPPAPTHSRYYPRDKARLDTGVEKWVSMAEALGWYGDAHMRSNYGTGGDASARGERSLDDPAATVTSKAGRCKWLLINNAQKNAAVRGTDEPAPTITAGHDSGGRCWVHERPATTVACDPRISAPGRHDPNESGSQQRGAIRVTVEQAAVLQSFPADYPWQGSRTKQFEQVGNAVPPGLARPVIQAALLASMSHQRAEAA